MEIKFNPGAITITEAAREACELSGVDIYNLIRKHVTGNWGDLPPDLEAQNERALAQGTEDIVSWHRLEEAEPYEVGIIIVTVADRSGTSVAGVLETLDRTSDEDPEVPFDVSLN
jgi:hypothetical protein